MNIIIFLFVLMVKFGIIVYIKKLNLKDVNVKKSVLIIFINIYCVKCIEKVFKV